MIDFQALEHSVHEAPRDAHILISRDTLLALFQRYTDMELQLHQLILIALHTPTAKESP